MSAQASQLNVAPDVLPNSAGAEIPNGRTLHTLARRSAGYLVLRYGLSMVINLGNMLVLTWWIGPHAYGIFVTAVALSTFLSSLARFGIDTYLIRCEPAPEENHYQVAFSITLGLSVGLLIVGLAAIPMLVHWYSSAEFLGPYLALLATVPLIGIAGPPFAKLERALDFRSVSAIELGGQLSAFLVAVVFAALRFGVWAPVGGFVVWQLVTLAAVCSRTRFRPRLRWDPKLARTMLKFGFGFSASLRTWQLRTLVNPLLVGRFAGLEAVAYVGLAIRIAEALSFSRTAAGRLAIAGLARLQQDRENLQSALKKALEMQVASLGPLLCAFAICGPWIVPRFLGPRWSPALDVYPLVAAGVLVNSVFNLQASALFVVGRQWAVMRGYAVHVALLAGGSAVLVPRLGIRGYGWAEVLACLGYVFILMSVAEVADLSYRKLLPLTALFLVPLVFAVIEIGHVALLVFPTVCGLAVAGHSLWPSPLNSDANLLSWRRKRRVRHLLTFLAKARQRGIEYFYAVLKYQFTAAIYHAQFWISSRRKFPHGTDEIAPPDNAGFHFTPGDIPAIVASIPRALKNSAISEAERALRHEFNFRGKEINFVGMIDWHARPGGSVSWQWDLNRHLFFVRLAASYHYTGDEKYLGAVINLWRDWIDKNPEGSANWQQPFEVAARLQNWIWAYFLLAQSLRVEEQQLHHFRTAMGNQANFLAHHLEYHWPNNHLLLEAKALYEFALLFPGRAGRNAYLRRSLRVLQREICAQVLPDGGHSELSSMYHRVVSGELEELVRLDVARTSLPPQQNFCKLNSRTLERIAGMAKFSRAITRDDGTTPLLGDAASADTYIRFELGQPTYSDLNYWLRPPIDETEKRTSRLQIFPDAGYAFFRSRDGTLHLTFDCGPFSRCACQNHAHCDALSFELYCHGAPWIVDPGVYFPSNPDSHWTTHFRSNAAHNTLAIDGRQQSEVSDLCDVERTASVSLLHQQATEHEQTVTAECVPYWSEGGIRHRREIVVHDQQQVRIRDEVFGAGTHRLEWTFQFAPDIKVNVESGSHLTTHSVSNRRTVSIRLAGQPTPRVELFCGCHSPLRGWVSHNSAQVIAATAAVYSLEATLPIAMEFTIDILP